MLDVASGGRSSSLPSAANTEFVAATDLISVRVGNHSLVHMGTCPAGPVPGPASSLYNVRLFAIDIAMTDGWTEQNFRNTGVIQTTATIGALADAGSGDPRVAAPGLTADFEIMGCGDGAGIQDPYITLTIMESNLVGTTTALRTNGNFAIGPPLMVAIDSDEAVPTLSFSPTDVEIDEGGMTSTVLLAEGPNADDVDMVKLSVEGDAMVSLMQDGEMLEEMDGHVYVDLDGNSSVRLTAMSHSDPDLMDGDMAFKAWKLMEGSYGRCQYRRGLLVQGRCPRLDGRAGATAGWTAPSGSVPDGWRRAAVSSAPGIARSSQA